MNAESPSVRLRPGLRFALQVVGVFVLAALFAAGVLLVLYAIGAGSGGGPGPWPGR